MFKKLYLKLRGMMWLVKKYFLKLKVPTINLDYYYFLWKKCYINIKSSYYPLIKHCYFPILFHSHNSACTNFFTFNHGCRFQLKPQNHHWKKPFPATPSWVEHQVLAQVHALPFLLLFSYVLSKTNLYICSLNSFSVIL